MLRLAPTYLRSVQDAGVQDAAIELRSRRGGLKAGHAGEALEAGVIQPLGADPICPKACARGDAAPQTPRVGNRGPARYRHAADMIDQSQMAPGAFFDAGSEDPKGVPDRGGLSQRCFGVMDATPVPFGVRSGSGAVRSPDRARA